MRWRSWIPLLGPGPVVVTLVAALGGADASATEAAAPAVDDPRVPVVFDGLGLEEFAGAGSVAAALRGLEAESQPADRLLGMPVDLSVRGPSGRGNTTDPLAAEFKSRIDRIDLRAGMQTDPAGIQQGPARWTGAVGVSNDHDRGREMLELKTSLARSQQIGILGIEVGPRIERRLRGGTVVFLDGKAQAQARRSTETGAWMMPGLTEQGVGGAGMVGVAASTGLVR